MTVIPAVIAGAAKQSVYAQNGYVFLFTDYRLLRCARNDKKQISFR
jgi:hypothetical protein